MIEDLDQQQSLVSVVWRSTCFYEKFGYHCTNYLRNKTVITYSNFYPDVTSNLQANTVEVEKLRYEI